MSCFRCFFIRTFRYYRSMDNSEDGCISIGQVEVIIKNEDVDKTEEIKELLRGYIGFEPVISVQ